MPSWIIERARALRRSMSPQEIKMWERLRRKQFKQLKFRRQHPIHNKFIVDFYCAKYKLIIEIDGSIHNDIEVKFNDKQREEYLKFYGYNIIRFYNSEVDISIDTVLSKISNKIDELK